MATKCQNCGKILALIMPSLLNRGQGEPLKCILCSKYHCQDCLKSNENANNRTPPVCPGCFNGLNKFPINRLEQLPARVLKSFLASRSISSAGCLDKSDLIRLIINSRPPMPPGQTVPNEPVTPYEEGISTAHSSNSGSREFVAASSGGEFGDLHSDGFFDRNSFLRNLFSDSSSATRNGDSRSVPPSAGDFAAFFGVTNNNLGEESPTTAPPRHQHQQSQSTSRQSASSASQQYNSQFLLSLSLNDIELMPTKRIKELLVTQHVSLTGVVERTDLVQVLLRTINGERISRNLQPLSTIPPPPSFSSSPSSYADTPPKPRKDIPKDIPDDQCCRICFENPMNAVLLECGHLCACIDCANQLSECPICRLHISRVIHTFRA